MSEPRTAVIIGAGPAGLTAAYELLERSDVVPVVVEQSEHMGGIARTVNHHGNRIDIGGHRFFSKSDRVMDWWLEILPLAPNGQGGESTEITYHRQSRPVKAPSRRHKDGERVMLVRSRRSRIYYLRQFFSYPIRLNVETLRKLGLGRTMRIGLSYMKSVLLPIRKPQNLEEFFINRFGLELYRTFFKAYTEKVWGTSCRNISAEWGAQRIKGLSITRALWHFLRGLWGRGGDIAQKDSETSLIEKFLYPKYGPGQMWEEVARRVVEMGGRIVTGHRVTGLRVDGGRIAAVTTTHRDDGGHGVFAGDFFFSTMAIQDLVRALDAEVPQEVKRISEGLVYRDFITVGLLLQELEIKEEDPRGQRLIRDNWIYIQEPDVQLGRLQIFNNWSPFMVADPATVWVGLEYFCNETDEMWRLADSDMIELAKAELEKIEIIDQKKVRDAVVIRMPKTYPAYFGTYDRFATLREYLDSFENLFLVGRNGMHKYNNQDHSMLTAMVAVDNIVAGRTDKANIWGVNTEEEYHEEKS